VFAETTKLVLLEGAVVMVRDVVPEFATVMVVLAVVVPITALPKSTFDGVGKRFSMSFENAPMVWFKVLVPSVTRNVAVLNSKPEHADAGGGLWRMVTAHVAPGASAPEQVVLRMSQKSVVLPPAYPGQDGTETATMLADSGPDARSPEFRTVKV
jgi:hypothetical protein